MPPHLPQQLFVFHACLEGAEASLAEAQSFCCELVLPDASNSFLQSEQQNNGCLAPSLDALSLRSNVIRSIKIRFPLFGLRVCDDDPEAFGARTGREPRESL